MGILTQVMGILNGIDPNGAVSRVELQQQSTALLYHIQRVQNRM